MQTRENDGVTAVVAAFNPNRAAFRRNLEGIIAQCDRVVVVDDGSADPVSRDELPAGVHLITQPNQGIAAALNTAIAFATEAGPTHIVTFDQDSLPAPGFIATSLATLANAARAGVDAIATCGGVLGGRATHATDTVSGLPTALQVAQSGMLYRPDAFARVGLFDTDLVIDAVDTDHVLRARARGARVVIARDAVLDHGVGETQVAHVAGRPLRVAGRTVRYSYHSGVRRYYITRNRLELWRRHRRTAAAWLIYDNAVEARTLALALLFGPRRGEQLRGLIAGVRDGACGRLGIIPSRTSAWIRGEHA